MQLGPSVLIGFLVGVSSWVGGKTVILKQKSKNRKLVKSYYHLLGIKGSEYARNFIKLHDCITFLDT